MKHIEIPHADFSPSIRDRLADDDEGIYVVYGVFIAGTSLNISRVYKGKLSEIEMRVNNPEDPSAADVTYLVPVPEFVVDYKDPQFAKYLNLHFVEAKEVQSDEEMMRRFAEAYTAKLSSEAVSQEAEQQAANDAQASANAGGSLEAAAQRLESALTRVNETAEEAAREIEVRKHQDEKNGFTIPQAASDDGVVDVEVKRETSD